MQPKAVLGLEETYNGADAEKPNDYVHDLYEILRILSYLSINLDLPKKLQAYVEIEDCADSNWAKEAHEESLTLL
jgi:hypothetical protein